ncbi:MAG: response regulator [Pseudomonadota bacterium]|nr:response regulator [Pseudomonadota bacterium]
MDDHPTNLRVMRLMLKRLHVRFDLARDGTEALLKIEQGRGRRAPYRLILLDARMPGMDGFAVAQAVRDSPHHADTSLLMLTSAGLRGDATRCKELGLNAYLTKHIALGELRAAMEAAISPPARQTEELPIYDRADALSRIADDEELLAMLIDLFLADAANYLDEIDTALRTSDWPRLTRAAQTLKGVLATFSACRGEASARLLESAAKTGDAAECDKWAAQTRIYVEAFLKVVR